MYQNDYSILDRKADINIAPTLRLTKLFAVFIVTKMETTVDISFPCLG